jgi:hypothetical protein
MIQKHFDAIDKSDIDALIADQVPESKTIEYKQTLPGRKQDDKKEFLADVSSFANASGGDIIYGIKAATNEDSKKTGAPDSVEPLKGETPDEAILRLENMIRNGIDPRPPVQIKPVPGWGNHAQEYVILVRIPKSFASPHMVTLGGSSRFYSRNSAGKYPLDVQELRAAFLATESQADRIKRFRQDRLAKIIADETPVPLSSPDRLVLHMIPIASFLNRDRLDLPAIPRPTSSFPLIGDSGSRHRYNLDGLLMYSGEHRPGAGHESYCQLFFDGSLESVCCGVVRQNPDASPSQGSGFIASVAYERSLIEAVESYLKGVGNLGLPAPFSLSLALLGCRGARMYIPIQYLLRDSYCIDRDAVILPDTIIENLDVDVPRILKPIFDAVWNACGFRGSLNYDETGTWSEGSL